MQFRANDRVSIDLGSDGVAQVRLTRPEKMNALGPEMFARIIEAGQALHEMKGLRAVVLSGEGRAFCAGLDLSNFAKAPDPDAPHLTDRTHGNSNMYQQVAMQWRKLPVPVIAAVHGVCFGGGLQIASGADIRVVAPDTRLAIMEMKWGLVPDMGGYALWRGLVRDEAAAFGLATHVDPDPLGRATAIAAEIANRNPDAVRGAKRLAAAMTDRPTDAILLEESLEQYRVMRTPNQIEAVMAGMEKRRPKFTDV